MRTHGTLLFDPLLVRAQQVQPRDRAVLLMAGQESTSAWFELLVWSGDVLMLYSHNCQISLWCACTANVPAVENLTTVLSVKFS